MEATTQTLENLLKEIQKLKLTVECEIYFHNKNWNNKEINKITEILSELNNLLNNK